MNFGTDNKELLEDIEEFDDNSKPNWMNMTRTAMNTIPYLGDSWVLPTGRQLYEEQTSLMKQAAPGNRIRLHRSQIP